MCERPPTCSAVGFCGHAILQMRKLRLKEVREPTKMHSQARWMPGSRPEEAAGTERAADGPLGEALSFPSCDPGTPSDTESSQEQHPVPRLVLSTSCAGSIIPILNGENWHREGKELCPVTQPARRKHLQG